MTAGITLTLLPTHLLLAELPHHPHTLEGPWAVEGPQGWEAGSLMV